jgi:hypothetical protein
MITLESLQLNTQELEVVLFLNKSTAILQSSDQLKSS